MKVRITSVILIIMMVFTLNISPVFASADSVFNVLDYGAKGDGVTDDAAAIQTAVNAAGEKGGIVFFPQGTYRVTSGIKLKSNLSISGSNNGFSRIVTTQSGKDEAVFSGFEVSQVSISGLTFSGSSDAVYAVKTVNCFNISVCDNIIETLGAALFDTYNKDEDSILATNDALSVKNNICKGSEKGCAVTVKNCNGSIVTGNTFEGYASGVVFETTDGSEESGLPSFSHNTCSDNTFTNIKEMGIYINESEMMAVTNNVIKNNKTGICVLNSANITISANNITDCSDSGIKLTAGCEGITINANTIRNDVAGASLMQVGVSGETVRNESVNIHSNSFHEFGDGCAHIFGGNTKSLSVTNNHFYNCYVDFSTGNLDTAIFGGNQMVFEGASTSTVTALNMGGTSNGGQLMIQNNQILNADITNMGKSAVVVRQNDKSKSSVTHIKGNTIRGFQSSLRLLADSPNPKVAPVFFVKNNTFDGTFLREEGTTQSSKLVFEDNITADGTNYLREIPSFGKWDKGQILYFENPAPGEYAGAICIAKGTPGIWKKFGKIE